MVSNLPTLFAQVQGQLSHIRDFGGSGKKKVFQQSVQECWK